MEGQQGSGAAAGDDGGAAKKLRTAGPTRGRGGAVPLKAAGRGRPPGTSGATPVKADAPPAGRQSQGLGRGLMGRAARAARPSITRAARTDIGSKGPAGWAGAAVPAPGADPEDGFAGTFAKELPAMMYGFGDDESPLQETVDVVEAALMQYLGTVSQRAMAVAQSSLKTKPDEKDVLFVVRKDPAKFARIKELLVMKDLIQDARAINKEAVQGGE